MVWSASSQSARKLLALALLLVPVTADAEGPSWSTVTRPNESDLYNYPVSVSCVASSGCTAVGSHYEGSRDATLALHSVDPNPPEPTTSTTSSNDSAIPVFTG